MIAVAACYRIETRWMRSRQAELVRTPVGPRAPEPLERRFGRRNSWTLVSAGFCGGLRQELRACDLVLADAVRHESEQILVGPELLQRARTALERAGHRPAVGPCASVSWVADGGRKRELSETGALSVDMESGPLCRWARDHGVPFLSLRVVLDPLEVDLPFAADGSVASSFLRHPVGSWRAVRSAIGAGRALGRALDALVSALKEES
jgi:hypothetical protein